MDDAIFNFVFNLMGAPPYSILIGCKVQTSIFMLTRTYDNFSVTFELL